MQTQPQGHDIRRLASMVRGAGCRGNYPPPVEGEKCSLTSPFIEQGFSLTENLQRKMVISEKAIFQQLLGGMLLGRPSPA